MRNPQRDGCGCPPWVVRCVHWDEQILSLVDSDMPTPEGMRGCHSPATRQGLFVTDGVEGELCTCGTNSVPDEHPQSFPDLAAAQAEFDRRAAELVASG